MMKSLLKQTLILSVSKHLNIWKRAKKVGKRWTKRMKPKEATLRNITCPCLGTCVSFTTHSLNIIMVAMFKFTGQ